MVKKSLVFVIIFIVFFISFVSADSILNDLHLNIQTTNVTTGEIIAGTYNFVFNISNESDCSPVLYSNSTTLTTDNRGVISYYLEDVNLDFDEQYYLCYYRDGVLINSSVIARNPYSFTAKNVTTSGIEVDSNMNFSSFNVSANYFIGNGSQLTGISGNQIINNLNWINVSIVSESYVPYSGANENVDLGYQNITTTGTGFFGWLGSLGSRITKLFVEDINASGNLIVAGNISVLGNVTSQTDFCIEGGNCLSSVSATETDPYWTENFSSYNSSWSSTYNSTYDLWAYNQTIPAISYANLNFLRKDGDNGTGIYNFNNGWQNRGLTISDGNLYAQAIYVYNISSLQVSNLDINGSLIPHASFDNVFDIGSSSLRWKDMYLAGNVYANGTVYSQGLPVLTSFAETDPYWTENFSAYNSSWSSTYNSSYVPYTGANQNVNLGNNNFSVGGSDLFVDNENGRVGIGTNNPSYTLDINGPVSASSSSFPVGRYVRTTTVTGGDFGTLGGLASGYLLKTQTSGNMADGFGGGIVFSIQDDTYGSDNNLISRIYARRDGADNAGALEFMIGTTGDDLAMILRASGNVGINTTTPQNTLNVAGSVNATGNVTSQTDFCIEGGNCLSSVSGGVGGNPFDQSLNTTESPTFNNLNLTGNLTLGQKITFALGGIIDNLVDGWVRITGGLNVSEDVLIGGNLNVSGTGNFTGNVTSQTDFCIEGGNCLSTVGGEIVGGSVNDTVINVTSAYVQNELIVGENKFNASANSNYTYFDYSANIGICWNETHIIWGENITGQCG